MQNTEIQATKCKNCNSLLSGNYCANCGQPTNLKRIDAHYIKHEIEHVLHLDKGIFFKIKELFLRTGKSVNEFFTENRNRLVKPIIFIIITSLVYTIINNYYHIEEQYVSVSGMEKTTVGKIFKWIQDHYGYANILMGVFIAFFIRLFFKKTEYNFYEILILLCFVIGIGMLIFSIFALFQSIFQINIMELAGLTAITYSTYAIADFFDKKKIKNYFKAFAAYILGSIAFFAVATIIGRIIDILMY